jgi:hypothetical protein
MPKVEFNAINSKKKAENAKKKCQKCKKNAKNAKKMLKIPIIFFWKLIISFFISTFLIN